jgi:hypothetical protein
LGNRRKFIEEFLDSEKVKHSTEYWIRIEEKGKGGEKTQRVIEEIK